MLIISDLIIGFEAMAARKRRASNEEDPNAEEKRAQTRAQKRAREEQEAQKLIAAGTGEYRISRSQFNYSRLL